MKLLSLLGEISDILYVKTFAYKFLKKCRFVFNNASKYSRRPIEINLLNTFHRFFSFGLKKVKTNRRN